MLPAPNLDDRRFQDLVDDAKRLVQRRCPEWTDHNVSDPGVTLIETFAFMVDQLLYRVNRVPDRMHVAFLELVGLQLYPPTSADVDVTFWLAAPQTEPVVVPAGTETATVRTEASEAVVFATGEDLTIPPVSFARVLTEAAGDGDLTNQSSALDKAAGFGCFSEQPTPGDAMYLGLSGPAPSCAVALRINCSIEGVGVDPTNPPLAWEAWDGERWTNCEVDRDETGGLNRAGDVVLHLPRTHVASVLGRHSAGWVRVRLVEPEEGQPTYTRSPRIHAVEAFTIGGTVESHHGEAVLEEVVGLSEGVPGQRFLLQHAPVVGNQDLVLEVAGGHGWDEWTQVRTFASSGSEDRHFTLDPVAGELSFGPAVREPDGSLTQRGAIPPKAAPMRLRSYRHGGGRSGNVARGAIAVVRRSIAGVARAENRRPAVGGVDAETLDQARDRAPVLLRTRDRAVTVEDYEHLAHEAAPEVARVRCASGDDGVVRVLVVPAVPEDGGVLRFEDLAPDPDTLERIARTLDERRCIGARVVVEPPSFQGVTVVARLRARSGAAPDRVRQDALAALYRYFHPMHGGPDGDGWPFGRSASIGEVYGVLQLVSGIEVVEDARLFAADPISGQRGEQVPRIDISTDALVFSFDHQLLVES